MLTLQLIRPLIIYVPRSREKDPYLEGGQVNQSETWAIIQLFHRYDTSHAESPFPLFLLWLSPYHDDDSGGWRKTTSVRFFTVTQNSAIFSFTLEPKKFSLQKAMGGSACGKLKLTLISPLKIMGSE
ncbi:hypothetical protein TNCV_3472611 [Trichonephila clavipes]|nr:hypothetical protein TNCV_3472611 [Trichonephila clavipes]